MYNHNSPDYFFNGKPVCQKNRNSLSVVAEKRRQVARMKRMRAIILIEMLTHICKRIFSIAGTGVSAVYVKTEYLLTAPVSGIWQSVNVRVYQCTVFYGLKSDNSVYIGIFPAPCHYRRSLRIPLYKRHDTAIYSVHSTISS